MLVLEVGTSRGTTLIIVFIVTYYLELQNAIYILLVYIYQLKMLMFYNV